MKNSSPPSEEGQFVHWNRVYLAVILYTAVLIIALWLFTRVYQ